MGREDRFSRNGVTAAEGKCTERIDVPCTEDLSEKLIALAVMAGRPKAEYARMLLTKAVEGEIAYHRSIGAVAAADDGSKTG